MNDEVQQYEEAALTVSASSFGSKEKDRHYLELLAHMRGHFGKRLMEELFFMKELKP
ncbi:hypothetical protein [Paenibacillus taihuensis]|uniref:hypothetical protein n=1 Tax=Paenibacillus taihuensis TaxID=1156355 RepID=UPI0015F24B66|nr:hypothetical protein [Paenibacillus taihuensis]